MPGSGNRLASGVASFLIEEYGKASLLCDSGIAPPCPLSEVSVPVSTFEWERFGVYNDRKTHKVMLTSGQMGLDYWTVIVPTMPRAS